MSEQESFQPVRPVRAYEAIVEQIEAALARGSLRPGGRLPSERDLMAQFSVSRSTVREALRVLESNGLIRSRPGDPNGAEVLPYSSATLRKSVMRLARVDELSLAELIQFRMILESAANALAARLRTAEQLEALESSLAAMESAVAAGYEVFSAADIAFHDVVAQVSANKLIQVCSEVVRGVALGLIEDKLEHSADRPALMDQSLRHHRAVLEAVKRGDASEASRLGRNLLYDYYAVYLPDQDRAMLRALTDEETPGDSLADPESTGRTS